jgi:hypothetical protein
VEEGAVCRRVGAAPGRIGILQDEETEEDGEHADEWRGEDGKAEVLEQPADRSLQSGQGPALERCGNEDDGMFTGRT